MSPARKRCALTKTKSGWGGFLSSPAAFCLGGPVFGTSMALLAEKERAAPAFRLAASSERGTLQGAPRRGAGGRKPPERSGRTSAFVPRRVAPLLPLDPCRAKAASLLPRAGGRRAFRLAIAPGGAELPGGQKALRAGGEISIRPQGPAAEKLSPRGAGSRRCPRSFCETPRPR